MIKNYTQILPGKDLGGKIHNLLKIRNDFNIPQGFILTEKEDINEGIYQYYNEIIKNDFYICRSSMNNEDSQKLSYAGLFDSIEGKISENSLPEDIKDVFGSLENDFLDEYEIKMLGNKIERRKMNVLVQEFIIGEVSGVYFSNYNGNRLIEYIKGCNQFLVEGIVKSNKIILDGDYKVIQHDKNMQYKFIGENLDIFIFEKENDSLNNEMQDLLVTELKRLRGFFNFEIDVEWTISNNELYILQVRPITIK